MTSRIDLTPENMRRLVEMAVASTPPTAWGPMDGTGERSPAAIMARTGESRELWTVYQRRDDGDWFCAITGNGEASEANAEFYANARAAVLSLVERVEELETQLSVLSCCSASTAYGLIMGPLRMYELGAITSGRVRECIGEWVRGKREWAPQDFGLSEWPGGGDR